MSISERPAPFAEPTAETAQECFPFAAIKQTVLCQAAVPLPEVSGRRREAGYEPGEPRYEDDAYADKVALLVADPVAVVSFTFGCPEAAVVRALHANGTDVATATTLTSTGKHDYVIASRSHSGNIFRLVKVGGERPLRTCTVAAGGHPGGCIDDVW